MTGTGLRTAKDVPYNPGFAEGGMGGATAKSPVGVREMKRVSASGRQSVRMRRVQKGSLEALGADPANDEPPNYNRHGRRKPGEDQTLNPLSISA